MAEPPRILDLGLSKPLSIRDRLRGERMSAALQESPCPHARRRVFSGRGGDGRNNGPSHFPSKRNLKLLLRRQTSRPQSPPENSLTAKAVK
jgi:hypothetical protein